MKDILLRRVFNSIAEHVRRGVAHGEAGWEAGRDEEDTLTGDLGSALRSSWSKPIVVGGSKWQWQIAYKKFGSRGKDADEKILGADGLFQIEAQNRQSGSITTKGLLFQAKKGRSGYGAKMIGQLSSMEGLAPGACAVFDYREQGYEAVDASKLIDPQHRRDAPVIPLADYLIDHFMTCSVGKIGLCFDASRQIMVVPEDSGEPAAHKFKLKHRIKIEVQQL